MKTNTKFLVTISLMLNLAATFAQGARGELGRGISSHPFGDTAKVFAQHSAFSAAYEIQTKTTSSAPAVTMSGTIARLDSKWRLRIDMGRMLTNSPFTGVSTTNLGAQPDELDSLTNLTVFLVWRPDKSVVWRTYSYPGVPMDGYFEERLENPGPAHSERSTEVTEIAKELEDNHPSVKSRFIVTYEGGKAQECTVWNASDLNGFPVRIEWVERNNTNTMLLKDVRLDRPDPALFEPPASKRYNAATLALDLIKTIRSLKKKGPVPTTE